MLRTGAIRVTALRWAGCAVVALAGCSNVGTKLSNVTGPKTDWNSPRVSLGQPQAELAARNTTPRANAGNAPIIQTADFSPAVNDETRARVAMAMAEMLEAAGNLAAAQEQYEESLKLDPKSLRTSLALARVHARLGRPDAALKTYQAAERYHRRSAALHNDKGLLLAETKIWPGAVESLRTAVKLDPSNSKFRNNLGMVLAASGSFDEAFKEFKEAVGAGRAHYNVAVMMIQAGKPVEARKHLAQAVVAMPQLAEARTLMARLDTFVRHNPPVRQLEVAEHVRPAPQQAAEIEVPVEVAPVDHNVHQAVVDETLQSEVSTTQEAELIEVLPHSPKAEAAEPKVEAPRTSEDPAPLPEPEEPVVLPETPAAQAESASIESNAATEVAATEATATETTDGDASQTPVAQAAVAQAAVEEPAAAVAITPAATETVETEFPAPAEATVVAQAESLWSQRQPIPDWLR